MVRVLLLFLQAQESEHVTRVERTGRERISLLHRRLLSWQGSAGGVGFIRSEINNMRIGGDVRKWE